VRVVCFGSIEQKVDDYLATNISKEVTGNEEIAEAYRRAIEVLWKFLKTHLKLDRMMSKNLNEITIQIYATPIVYLILQLYAYGTAMPIEIPRIYGSK
jgi:putative transposase